MSIALSCQGLSHSFPMAGEALTVLDNINLQIKTGEMLAIMGPSGSGKSTLMNLLGCLMTPVKGRLTVLGQQTAGMSREQLAALRSQHIGFVFQQFNLLARTSAQDNVQMPLMYNLDPARNDEQRALHCLDMVGLGDRAGHTPSQLSGGQQQRVAIARALVNQPKILLADEPTGALDTKTGKEIMALFKELNSSGITVILVTHEPEIAAYADRTIMVRDGKVENAA
ncbi:ABC transporter ATP-binding protein [Shewanella sp. KX20019]|uniref:ABC transporter ATP-binding protein n=1 Tax=Shewanella sp. KX20019 TaxID=2803864 RepID=UPI0019287146|nr:ABC transporter ATP-binding protein [Shewanella sp. KX20019]QQX79280.1 ABC transporter ATP-binding protein [Shewanella sp. KX20019]